MAEVFFHLVQGYRQWVDIALPVHRKREGWQLPALFFREVDRLSALFMY
jgi:hypothetical protein